METVTRRVFELDGIERSVAERLVGHGLRENQQLNIQIVDFEIGEEMEQVANSDPGHLPAWCSVYAGMTDDDVDDVEKSIIRMTTMT